MEGEVVAVGIVAVFWRRSRAEKQFVTKAATKLYTPSWGNIRVLDFLISK